MSEQRFDFIEIIKAIYRRKFFILGFAVLAGILGFVFCSFQERLYRSETTFIVKNPTLIDRNFTFRTTSYEHKDFFATADDVDNIVTLGESNGLIGYLIEKFDLGKAYGIDNPGKLFNKVKKNFKFTREDTKNIRLYYSDPDAKRAQAITLAARDHLQDLFQDYFISTNQDLTKALYKKADAISDTIARLDDSMMVLRTQTGAYGQLQPSRGNSVIYNTEDKMTPEKAIALEKIQEMAATKDRLVTDRAGYNSLINEFEVIAQGKIRLFYIVEDASLPEFPAYPIVPLIVAACTLAGFFFATILTLILTLIRNLNGKL